MDGWLFDVKDFGAVGDGTTDDSAAFHAAMDAMGTVTSGKARHGTLFVPPGDYRLEDDLLIERALKMHGTAPGSGWSKSRLTFAPYKGVRMYGAENSPRGGDAQYATIEDLDIYCAHSLGSGIEAPVHPVWTPLIPYAVGDRILPRASRAERPGATWEYYYECIRAGTSGDEEPDWSLVQSIEQSSSWHAATPYYYSNVVRAPQRYDVFFQPVTPAILMGSRTSGGVMPAEFATAMPGQTVHETTGPGPDDFIDWLCAPADGYLVWEGGALAQVGDQQADNPADPRPVWACRVAAGIYSQTSVLVNRVYIEGALNAAVHLQASASYLPASNADGFALNALYIRLCGCGIVARGDDCQAGMAMLASITTFNQSDKEVGIAERSFLGNRYYSCQVAACGGPAYLVTSPDNSGGLYGCYAEIGATGPIKIGSQSFGTFGGTYPPFAPDARGWRILDRFLMPQFYVHNDLSPAAIETYVGYDDGTTQGALGFGRIAPDGLPMFYLVRWSEVEHVWSTEYRAPSPWRATYLTEPDHERGTGLQGFPRLLLGPAGPQEAVQVEVSAARPADGTGQPGDLVFNKDPKPADFVGWVCVQAGGVNTWKGFGQIEA
jgi:hypothetical protein